MTGPRPPPAFDPAELSRIPEELLSRYDVAGPRYTSYPTAPVWSDDFTSTDYERVLEDCATRTSPLSIYIHIPFCESLCVYCGCSVVITRRRDRAEHYLKHVEHEIDRVAERVRPQPGRTVQVAWGGGTPTYLEPDQIKRLMGKITDRFPVADGAELGIEVDPRVTTREHVRAIVEAGFNRISMGVQDFDPAVQEEIHRVQSFELTRDLVRWCREEGIASVNLDLVYGLPLQTLHGFGRTLDLVAELDPDRISAFSYAHVPWLKPAQKKFDEATLPRGPEKFRIFAELVQRLGAGGYEFIGMDHFAKPSNELSVAQAAGELWRNFQGFTTKAGTDLLGFGVTSIGSFDDAFAQNTKDLVGYATSQREGRFAVTRGMWLSKDDKIRRAAIQQIMCNYRFDADRLGESFDIDGRAYFASSLARLDPLVADGMVVPTDSGFELTSRGRVFVRNVCMPFDAHLTSGPKRVFSRTV